MEKAVAFAVGGGASIAVIVGTGDEESIVAAVGGGDEMMIAVVVGPGFSPLNASSLIGRSVRTEGAPATALARRTRATVRIMVPRPANRLVGPRRMGVILAHLAGATTRRLHP